MHSTFVNPVVNPDTRLGVATYDQTHRVQSWEQDSYDEIEVVIQSVYKQVLGNAYVMESERLVVPESQFRRGELDVVEFIRAIAYSDLYRTRFFENGPRNRFIELNFKHFLGRAPKGREEIAEHSTILDESGYEAEIDSYLDSDEYQENFGEYTVPYYRGYKTGAADKLVAFTHMFPLLRGRSSSDKHPATNNPARLNSQLMKDKASNIVPPSGATSRRGSGEVIKSGNWMLALLSKPKDSQSQGNEAKASQSGPAESSQPAPSGSELEQKSRAQLAQIEQLKKQIDRLRSLSSIGESILRKGQRPAAFAGEDLSMQRNGSSGYSSLQQQVDAQAKQIENLQGELMSARSLSSIAEYSLNKWRQRSY